MFYACVQRFDVTGNLKNFANFFWKLNGPKRSSQRPRAPWREKKILCGGAALHGKCDTAQIAAACPTFQSRSRVGVAALNPRWLGHSAAHITSADLAHLRLPQRHPWPSHDQAHLLFFISELKPAQHSSTHAPSLLFSSGPSAHALRPCVSASGTHVVSDPMFIWQKKNCTAHTTTGIEPQG
jgi:hypothetical protein